MFYSSPPPTEALSLQALFAIVDIETCGSRYEFRKGRIIEICIVMHDGLSVTNTFTTLINPECFISPYFTRISGITNEMVAHAPKFHEVARQIIDCTEGRIFVAHNASFDYHFIRDEFNALGYTYRRETLCTVRLSRKLIPNRISYSLGHLCASLGIHIEGRHRAEGDAVATAALFDLLIRLKNEDPRYRNQGVEALMVRRIDKIKAYILQKLPETCGVYYFLNREKEIIYIGKSTNMYNRALQHFQGGTKKSGKLLGELMNVDFVETGSELVALLMEAEEIKKHKPRYNAQRKNKEFSHCIDYFTDAQGVINFKIVSADASQDALLQFNTYSTARERVDSWIAEHQLCLSHCGLTPKGSSCFHHQIHQCKGICNQEEDVASYNLRASKIVAAHSFATPSFVIIDRGRQPDERALVLVQNNRYKGFGYLSGDNPCSPNELVECIQPAWYYPDANDLIRGWMRNRRDLRVIPLPALPENPYRDEDFY